MNTGKKIEKEILQNREISLKSIANNPAIIKGNISLVTLNTFITDIL
jgi:hypothetical protein